MMHSLGFFSSGGHSIPVVQGAQRHMMLCDVLGCFVPLALSTSSCNSRMYTLLDVIGRFVLSPENAVLSRAVPGTTAVPSRI